MGVYSVLQKLLGSFTKKYSEKSHYLQNKKKIVEKLRQKGIKIGENVNIISTSFDDNFPFLIKIGDNCTITNATILTHDASLKIFLGKVKVGKVVIGNNCFIGYGSIILPNVTIGNNCIIAAGAVVSRDIPPYSVAAGVPAKPICTIESFIKKNENKPYLVGTNLPNIPTLKQLSELTDTVQQLHSSGFFKS